MEEMRQRAQLAQVNLAEKLAMEQKRQTSSRLDYAEFLRVWWNSMPPAVRHHPWSIETIAAAAFSGEPRHPALRCVAQALRNLGFSERRDWTRAGRNRRQWIPPTDKLTQPRSTSCIPKI
jgi:hypothetical protein